MTQPVSGGRPLPVSDSPAVYVLHENPEWFPPFAAAFASAGVPLVEWELTGGSIELDRDPPAGVFWSRFSASSHTRGHGWSKDHTRSVLSWLEAAGRRTVNGRAVLELEVSKVAQLVALRAHGIDTPRTVAVIGSDRLAAAAARFVAAADDPAAPFLIKHNQGGKGLGVNKFDSLDALRDHLASDDFEEPVDGITLLQEYVRPADGTITRCEFVGREFVYAIRADTLAGGFQLCPADACAIGPDGRPVIPPGAQRAPEPGEQIFRARHDVDGLPLEAYRSFLAAADIEIAGIELIEAENGRIITYDVNTNTNYNAAVEATIDRSGPAEIARYLGSLLDRSVRGGQ